MTFTIPKSVSAISFDIWGTLLHGNKAFSRARLQLIFDLLDLPFVDLDEVHAAYLYADRFCNHESETTGFDCGMRERLELMLGRLNLLGYQLPGDMALAAIQQQVGRLRLEPRFMPVVIESDIVAILQTLTEQGKQLGLLSNTGMDNQQVMEPVLRRLGIWQYCQVAIFSSEDGRAKPNPDLFKRMTRELDVAPDKTVHIGDNVIADYQATMAGLRAVLYAPGGSELVSIRSMKELIT